MGNDIQTAEQAAQAQFMIPVEQALSEAINGEGKLYIRSDAGYERAGNALKVIRQKRKGLAAYFKEPAPEQGAGPGQGLVYYTRKAWNAANDLFNRFDSELKSHDEQVDGDMKRYRAEVERKAREEAERQAAIERARLEAEAAERRRLAEEERKKQEAALAEQKRIAEEERQKRLAAELEAANSKKAKLEAERKAQEERRLAELAEQEEKDRIQREAEAEKMEAERLAEEARNVVSMPVREVPKVAGVSVRKRYKARLASLGMLVKAISEGKAPLSCVKCDESACNKLANAFGGQNPPPGLQFYVEETSSARTK